MSLTLVQKRGRAIGLLLTKQAYEKDQQLKLHTETRKQLSTLTRKIDALQIEMDEARSALGKPLYVDEIIRLQNYLHHLTVGHGKLLVEFMKVNGICQRQIADLKKNQARTHALEQREEECQKEIRRTVEKLDQNSLDESVLFKFQRILAAENESV